MFVILFLKFVITNFSKKLTVIELFIYYQYIASILFLLFEYLETRSIILQYIF